MVPLSYYGVIRVQPRKLAISLAISLLLLAGLIFGGRASQSFLIEKQPDPYLHFTLGADLSGAIQATVHGDASSVGEQSGPPRMDRIRQTGTLRVGFSPHVIPFSYFNAANELVGYDIAYAYALARDLGVDLELIPITDWATLSDDLKAGRYDLAVGGVYVTDERLEAVTVSKPYMQSQLALIVRSDNAQRFLHGPTIKRQQGLKIATFKSDIVDPMARTLLPRLKS